MRRRPGSTFEYQSKYHCQNIGINPKFRIASLKQETKEKYLSSALFFIKITPRNYKKRQKKLKRSLIIFGLRLRGYILVICMPGMLM